MHICSFVGKGFRKLNHEPRFACLISVFRHTPEVVEIFLHREDGTCLTIWLDPDEADALAKELARP